MLRTPWVWLQAMALGGFVTGVGAAAPPAAKPHGEPISSEQFAALRELIRPAPGESRWAEIPWLLSVYEARKRAAEEGKPILLWSAGGGAPPIGGC